MKQVPFHWSLVLSAHVVVQLESEEAFGLFCENLPSQAFWNGYDARRMRTFWLARQDCFRFKNGRYDGEGTAYTYLSHEDGYPPWPDCVFTVYDGSLPEMSATEVSDLL